MTTELESASVLDQAGALYEAAHSFEVLDGAAQRATEFGFDPELASDIRVLFRERLKEVRRFLEDHQAEIEEENRITTGLLKQILHESAQVGIVPSED